MISGVLASASASPEAAFSSLLVKPKPSSYFSASLTSVSVNQPCLSDLKLKSVGVNGRNGSQRGRVKCNSSTGPGGPGFGIVF